MYFYEGFVYIASTHTTWQKFDPRRKGFISNNHLRNETLTLKQFWAALPKFQAAKGIHFSHLYMCAMTYTYVNSSRYIATQYCCFVARTQSNQHNAG